MTKTVRPSPKSGQKQQNRAGPSARELDGVRAGRGGAWGAWGAEGEAGSCCPVREPRKPCTKPLTAELCEVSPSASSAVFIYPARVRVCSGGRRCGQEVKPCRQKAAAAARVGLSLAPIGRAPRANRRHPRKLCEKEKESSRCEPPFLPPASLCPRSLVL